jgi:tetratricopeptide (TPR) repeat protein
MYFERFQCLRKFAHICFVLFGFVGHSIAVGYISSPALRPGTNRVAIAVLGFDASSNDLLNVSWLVQGLIQKQLKEEHDIYLCPDIETDYALRALRLKSPIDRQQAALVAKLTKADWVVWGACQYDSNRLSLTAYAVNANNTAFKCVSATSRDFFNVRDHVTFSLLGEMKIPLTGEERQSMLRRWTASALALRDYGLAEACEEKARPWTNAESYLKSAISADPKFSEAYCNLAAVLFNEGKMEEAIEAANRALDLRGNYAAARQILAVILDSEHRVADSEVEFKSAIRLDPDRNLQCQRAKGKQSDRRS